MGNVTSDTFGKVDKLANNGKDKLVHAEDQLTQLTYDAGKKIGTYASDFATKTASYAKTCRDYVKENPGKGMAVVAFAGLLTGSLLTMAMRRRH